MSKAKGIFERHLESLRRTAIEKGVPFVELLSTVVHTSNAMLLIADALLDPPGRERALLKRYEVQFYEWMTNLLIKEGEAYYADKKGRIKGGKVTAAKRQAKRNEVHSQILLKASELLAGGHKERGLNKRIASALGLETNRVERARREMKKIKNRPDASLNAD